jgi:hypothetical protein
MEVPGQAGWDPLLREVRSGDVGVREMKSQMFDMTRMWAMLTGLALAVWYFGASYLGVKQSELLPMLVTAIGGFELFLYGQDVWLKRKKRHG